MAQKKVEKGPMGKILGPKEKAAKSPWPSAKIEHDIRGLSSPYSPWNRVDDGPTPDTEEYSDDE